MLQSKYFKIDQLNDEIPLFAFIGRVTKQKGVHLIIDAI
jgi:glycogen synthase